MSTKVPTPSKIVQNPRLWPSSFSKPVTYQNTCIRTYIFKDGTKVEKFLDFVNKSFPNRKVEMKKMEDGKVSVSLTFTSKNQATNDETICGNIYTTSLTTCSQKKCSCTKANRRWVTTPNGGGKCYDNSTYVIAYCTFPR